MTSQNYEIPVYSKNRYSSSQHNSPLRVNMYDSGKGPRDCSAVIPAFETPSHSNIFDSNNYPLEDNQRYHIYSTPANVRAIERDIMGRDTYGTYEMYDTPARTTEQRRINSREPYRNIETGHQCDEWLKHNISRSAEKADFNSLQNDMKINSAKAFREDVMKVVKPIIENLWAESLSQNWESNVFVVNQETLSNQPKGTSFETTKKIDAKVGNLTESMKSHDSQIQQLGKELLTIKRKDIASQAADVQGLVTKVRRLELLQTEITAKWDSLLSKIELANKAIIQSEQSIDRKIKQIKIPDIDQLNFVKYPTFETMGHAIEDKITEMDEQITKLEHFQKNSVKDLEKKIKESKISELDKVNFVSSQLFEAFGHGIEDKITEMDEQMAKIEQFQKNSARDLEKKIKEIKIPDIDQFNFVKYPNFEALGNAIEAKISEIDDKIIKIDQTQIKSIKDLEKKIKEWNNIDIDKLNFVKVPFFETFGRAIEEKITEMDDQMIKIEQFQKKSVKDLEIKIKDSLLDFDKLNYVKSSAFESMGNAIEVKITEIDEQIDKIEQTQKAFSKDFDKKIKDINVPDLDKLNFVKYSIFEAMGNAIEGKITEMDSQIEKIENQLKTKLKNEVKNFGDIMKETDKLIKQAKETDKSDFATISMIDIMATALDKKIEEIEGKFNLSLKGITKYEESQNKSIKELELKIKDVKAPDF